MSTLNRKMRRAKAKRERETGRKIPDENVRIVTASNDDITRDHSKPLYQGLNTKGKR